MNAVREDLTTLPELIVARAARSPGRTAVRAHDGDLTYAELAARSAAAAGALRDRGLRPGDVVGVRVERGAGLVVTLLGVLRAGLTYLPLDPDHPAARADRVLADAGAAAVLTDVPAGPVGRPAPPVPDGLAYLIHTSGSTGRPKGVMVPHRAVTALVASMRHRPGLTEEDTVVAVTTVAFDISVVELFLPLVVGATVVVATRAQATDPEVLAGLLAASGATVMQATPTTWRMLLDSGWSAPAGFRAWCGGELMPPDLARRFRAARVEVWDLYGPTETTVWSAVARLGEGGLTDWSPLDGEDVHVLGPDLAPATDGEVCVSGAGLAWGYAGRPALTATRFVPWPGGARLYRTGDVGRRLADGRVEILGRTDHQVKINGHRIELGEVETALATHPSVDAVVVHPHDRRLVAHLVGAAPASAAQLRAHLAARLPDYMVPSAFQWLPRLPLTLNGKVDRAALPAPGDRDHLDQPYEPPAGPVEELLAGVWRDLLGVARIGRHDDFFHLGGDSLHATRLVTAVRARTGTPLTVTRVFAARTLARIAGLVTLGPPAPAPAIPGDAPPAMTSGQRALWFLNQLDPADTSYHEQLVLSISGPLVPEALARAFSDVVARHEPLRTRFTVGDDGEPRPEVDPPRPVTLPVHAEAGDLLAEQRSAPFDLATGPVLRVLLVRVGAGEHLLALTIHHIACDELSTGVLADELAARYGARDAVAPVGVDHGAVAAWQRDWLTGADADRERAYWRDQLAGLRPVRLPVDRPRAAVRDTGGGAVAFTVPVDLARRLTAVAAAHGATDYMLYLAAFQVLLARYSGETDIAVGSPTAGRDHAGLDDVIGHFVNTLVLRTDLAGRPTFTEALGRVRATVLAAMDHRRLPFDALVAAVAPDRDPAENPLFEAMFAYLAEDHRRFALPGLTVAPVPVPRRGAKFALTVELTMARDGGLAGEVEYRTALFDERTATRVAGHYLRLLEAVAQAPDQPVDRLPILTDQERAALRAHTGERSTWSGGTDPLAAFESWARTTPTAVAVHAGGVDHTYADLDVAAERLADALVAAGARPAAEARVAVLLDRGLAWVVAFLAVLKAGAVFCPVAPGHPAGRRRVALTELAPDVLVTDATVADGHPGPPVVRVDAPPDAPPRPAAPPPVAGQAAYVILTSGSTGRPKGVVVTHEALAHHCAAIATVYRLDRDDRVLVSAPPQFDLAVEQLWGPLAAGATAVLADPEPWPAETVLDRIAGLGLTFVDLTPGYYREVMAAAGPDDPRLAGLRVMNVGSDRVTARDVRWWSESGRPGRFLVTYGPTEATVTATTAEPAAPVDATIGTPLPGTRAHVLDAAMNHCPVGVPGELHLGGPRLARGYHRAPARTATRFVPDPFGPPGGRLYRTGDVVRLLTDGTLEFVGRTDDQVNVRGHRIEPAEVESALAGHPHVRAAAVVARTLGTDDTQLVAYVVLAEGSDRDAVELRAFLADLLPSYLLPTQWVSVPALPRKANGKLDKDALPAPVRDREILRTPYVPPTSRVERELARVWESVLGTPNPGVHDNFFELGGHSLHVIKSLGRIKQTLPVELTVMDLFGAQCIADLAALIERRQHSEPRAAPVAAPE